jgi:hypothetical protein
MFDGKVTRTAVEGFFAFSGDKKDKNSRLQSQKVSRKGNSQAPQRISGFG